jgi:hypothetical protein
MNCRMLLQLAGSKRSCRIVESKGDLAPRPASRNWTRVDDYLGALARRRTYRHRREPPPGKRTMPEAPRFALSTLPFLLLFAGLAVMAIAIAVAAWPGQQRAEVKRQTEARELGTAPKGWLQDAQRRMHRQS